MPIATRTSRRGVGVLPVIVLVLLMVMALTGFAQRFFGGQVQHQTYRLAMGRLAEQLARSAVDEGLHFVRARANDPSSPLFRQLRQETYPDSRNEVPLEIQVPNTERIASEAPYKGFFLEDVRADVVYQAQFSQLPYEKFGLLRVRARAGMRMGLTEKVSRTAEAGLDLKVVLGSTPRPFDQTTVYIQDGASIGISRANRKMEESLRTLEELRVEKAEMARRVESRVGEIREGSGLPAEYQALEVPVMGGLLHPFDEDRLVLFRVQDRVDLKELDLAGAVSRFEGEAEPADRRLGAARSGVEAAFTDAGAHRELLAALREAISKRSRFLQWLVNFQNATSEYSGDAASSLGEFDYKLEQIEWKRKAAWWLRESEGSVNAQLAALLKHVGRLDGVVFVENPGETLELDGELGKIRGLAQIAATGQVRLAGTNREAGPGDLLTVVSFGRMSVEGEVRASLIPRDKVFVPPSATIHGNLVLREASESAALQGTVVRDPRYFSGRTTASDSSGAFTDYYAVTLAPRLLFREVQR